MEGAKVGSLRSLENCGDRKVNGSMPSPSSKFPMVRQVKPGSKLTRSFPGAPGGFGPSSIAAGVTTGWGKNWRVNHPGGWHCLENSWYRIIFGMWIKTTALRHCLDPTRVGSLNCFESSGDRKVNRSMRLGSAIIIVPTRRHDYNMQ